MEIKNQIEYLVISCTSEDKDCPTSSIQDSNVWSTGWLSQKNPSFPIHLKIDLQNIFEISQICIISHESKIPSKIDLSISSNSTTHFSSVGSFLFSDNSQTKYQARECKKVSLKNVSARYVLFSITGVHKNEKNPDNQVGIISLKIGSTFSIPQRADPGVENLIHQLEQQKKEAVAREDYRTAHEIKTQLDDLRMKYERFVVLQEEKARAIENEDFKRADELKKEAENLFTFSNNPSEDRPLSLSTPHEIPESELPSSREKTPSEKRKSLSEKGRIVDAVPNQRHFRKVIYRMSDQFTLLRDHYLMILSKMQTIHKEIP